MFAPSNILANMAEAEELICEIYLCPATVFWDGGGISYINQGHRAAGCGSRRVGACASLRQGDRQVFKLL